MIYLSIELKSEDICDIFITPLKVSMKIMKTQLGSNTFEKH